MNLRERLDWAFGLSSSSPKTAGVGGESSLRPLPWGEVISTPFGTCVRVEERLPLDYAHGLAVLGSLLGRQPHTFGALDRAARVECAHPDELCFFDSETTGLAGGVGTVPFLIGVGYFTENAFVIEQFFARDFDEEPALLSLALEKLSARPKWVTYNGKAFDAQLLAQRLRLHRLGDLPEPLLHVDLLFAVRRLWKDALGECSLSRAEERILVLRRDGDLPRSLIPLVYFRYLRDRDPWPLRAVFEHNRLDVLSLVALLDACALPFEAPERAPLELDALKLARLLIQRGRIEHASRVLERALSRARTTRLRKRMLIELASLYKRRRLWRKAVELWDEAIRLPGFTLEPYVELAKYYEHRARQLDKAEQLTRQALEGLRLLSALRGDPAVESRKAELQARLQRLQSKRGRA